jgi:tRNA(Ile)-lysidine synthase
MADTPLVATLSQALRDYPVGSLCVAFSGGPDSTALLHALASLPEAHARGLRGLHIDHGLHADSDRWAAHCRDFCAALGVPLAVVRVDVPRDSGLGLEAAAREARYAAFAESLADGESLLLAHHRDDQAETVLLKLLRGAGPEGLGGMRARRVFAAGWLWRPLLGLPRDALLSYVAAHAPACIDDPSNRSPHLARSYLRNDILPRLAVHWPQAPQSIGHAARLSRAAADYVDMQSRAALSTLHESRSASLDAPGWLALHEALRVPVLERWLRLRNLPVPTFAQCAELERQVGTAAADRLPRVNWPGAEVHLWRGRLYAFAPLQQVPARWQALWHGEPLSLPGGAGTLRWVATEANDDDATFSAPVLQVRLGETGVRLRPAGDRHTRELRDLFQRAGVPPWRRRRCPLLYDRGGTLLAVADLWRSETGQALFAALGRAPRWLASC